MTVLNKDISNLRVYNVLQVSDFRMILIEI